VLVSSAGQCRVGQFRCNNDRCIPDSQVCDGKDQCSDGSDEGRCQTCKESYVLKPFYPIGRSTICMMGPLSCVLVMLCYRCVQCLTWVGVGVAVVVQKCSALTYQCKSGVCISKMNPECDGQPDCEDASDEANCGTYTLAITLTASQLPHSC